jgi:hypothetical protein
MVSAKISRNITRLIFLSIFSVCIWLMAKDFDNATAELSFTTITAFIGILFGFSATQSNLISNFVSAKNLIIKILFIIIVSVPFFLVESINFTSMQVTALTEEYRVVGDYFSSEINLAEVNDKIETIPFVSALTNSFTYILALLFIPLVLSTFDKRWGYYNVIIGVLAIGACLMFSGPSSMSPTEGMEQPTTIEQCSKGYEDSWEEKSKWMYGQVGGDDPYGRQSDDYGLANRVTRNAGSATTQMNPFEFKYQCDDSLDEIRDTDMGSCQGYSECISVVKFNMSDGKSDYKKLSLRETLKFLEQSKN